MSKFKHIHINTDINGKSKNSSKAVDKFGSKSTKNQKDKNNSFEKRKKKVNEESDEEDEKNEKRFNSQARRKMKKDKEDIEVPKKGSTSFEKRKVKPKKEKEKKTNEKNKKDKKKQNKKKEESDDDESGSSSSSSSSSSEIVVNKNYKKMKTVAAKDAFKKKVQDIPKKTAKNAKEDKMNVTYNKAKSSLIEEKSNNTKKDKNYLSNKEKTHVVKFATKKTKKIEDDDEKKKKRKEISGKSADRATNRKGDKPKKDGNKKNNKKKDSNSANSSGSSQSDSESITPSSSSYSSEDEKDEKAKPANLTKSKTNINNTSTKLEEADKQNQKTEEKKENPKPQDQKILDNVPNLASMRPPPPDGRKGSIILGTKYLRRRSMDNPYTRERLELLVNQMTLKQNGGNTLFLKNYEPGPTYIKEITHITKDKQTIKKHIKISSCTKAGCKGPGIVKTNQDAFFIKENFLKNNEYFYIGVCDGHGEFGHVVSNFVINKLPSYIKDLSNESITSAFKKTNSEIYGNSKLDSSMSGTTVVSIVLTPNNIQCVNLGDSRAALFKYDNGIYYCKNLSRDHKPAEADEARRIDLNGGRVKRCYDEDHKRFVGPERVWMKNKEEPGLAMTRSLGDKIAHNIGVSDEPEFKTFTYDGTEKYIIIASDGLWEYVSGDQCIAIVKPFYEEGLDAQEAALALTKEAFRRWKRKEVAIDDITVVVIFFY